MQSAVTRSCCLRRKDTAAQGEPIGRGLRNTHADLPSSTPSSAGRSLSGRGRAWGGNGRHSAQTLGWPRFTPPALGTFPGCPSLLWKAWGQRHPGSHRPPAPASTAGVSRPQHRGLTLLSAGCPVLQPAEEADRDIWGPPWKSTPTFGRLPTSPPLRRMNRGGLMAEKVNVGIPRGE